MFQKASALKKSTATKQSFSQVLLNVHFDAEESAYSFFSAATVSSKAGLPASVAMVELARTCCTSNVLVAPTLGGWYGIGPQDKVERAMLKQARLLGLELQLSASEPDTRGVPSSIVREVVTFAITSHLLARGFSLLKGTLVHEFDKSQGSRAGLQFSIEVPSATTVLIRVVSLKTFRGANSGRGILAPGEPRYALPDCKECRLVDIFDQVPSQEELSAAALRRYWQTLYGLHWQEPEIFAHVVLGGGRTFTYPVSMLLSTAIVEDPKSRPQSLTQQTALEDRFLSQVRSLPLFQPPPREE